MERQQRSFWILLTFVAAFLGHDLLMAADVHAIGRHYATMVHHEEVAARPATHEHPVLVHGAHDENCFTTRSVVQPSNNNLSDGLASSVALLAEHGAGQAHFVHEWWREPAAPPGIRRALIQVYRI
jgi:hypothetical protein